MTTSQPSTPRSDSVTTTSSQLDFHAKICPSQDDRQDSKTALDQPSSTMSSALLGKFDLDSFCLKTLDIYCLTKTGKPSKKSSFKLPKQGMMQNGELYQLEMWEPVTSGNASGLSPTPMTQDTIALPTPTASDVEGGIAKDVQFENNHFFRQNKQGVRWGVKLRDVAPHLPTPTARDYKDSGDNMNYEKASKKFRLAGVLNHTHSTLTGEGTYLNPQFVEEMMGYPIGWTDLNH